MRYNSELTSVVATDAGMKGLEGTLRQEHPKDGLKLITYVSQFLTDTKKQYAITVRKLLAVVWRFENVRLYVYGQPIKIVTDPIAEEWKCK